ncbi:hypothetical protein [Clostridioides difficile]|uniref:hypothetical protein n=1 Tax=Clostridioides difficile TaxID=1496 RepID=UPI001F4176C3|nr:hypothetical protein [Clostridioides difficile]
MTDKYNLNMKNMISWIQSMFQKILFLLRHLEKYMKKKTGLDGTPLSSGGATYAKSFR